MEDSQKMAALKRAYADIILNSAKEAATRVMLSERKAVRYQQELRWSKEEALRMLLRFKHIIDAKTIEAEMTSLTQKNKIDELEAQLHEAEDIITELRSELEWLRSKLKKQNTQPESLDGRTAKTDISDSGVPTPRTTSNLGLEAELTSDMKSTSLNDTVLDTNCKNTTKVAEKASASGLLNFSIQKSDLPSIFVRSKESEQYRNGCTQRIRALDRNLFDGKLLENANGQQSSPTVSKMSDKDENSCLVPFPYIKNMELVKIFSQKIQQPVESHPLRKNQIQSGETNGTSRKSHLHLSAKACESTFVLSSCKTCSVETNCDLEEKNFSDNNKCTMSDHEPISCNGDSSSAFVSADSSMGKLKAGECESKMKPLPRLSPGLTLLKSNVGPVSELKNVTLVENGEVKVTEKSIVPCSELSAEMVNVSMMYSDQNEGGKSTCKTDTDRFLKCTFQRKRKKESSIDPDSTGCPEPSELIALSRKRQQSLERVLPKTD
ncbi:hypothetical protein ACFE04_010504 [Oxalis oulophora]